MNNIQNRNRIAINTENIFELPSKNQINSTKPKLALNDRTNNHSTLRDGAKMASNKLTGSQKTATAKKMQKPSFVIAQDIEREPDHHFCSKSKLIEPFDLDMAFECLMSFKTKVPKPEEKFEFEELDFDYDMIFDLPEQPEQDYFRYAPELDVETCELPPMPSMDLPDIDYEFDF